MAVTRKGRSIIMTAANDAFQFPIKVKQVRFVGTGLTVGQQLLIKEVDTNGAVICNHFVLATTEDAVVVDLESWVRRPFIDVFPAAGGGQVVFQLM